MVFIPNAEGRTLNRDDEDVSKDFKDVGMLVQMPVPHISFSVGLVQYLVVSVSLTPDLFISSIQLIETRICLNAQCRCSPGYIFCSKILHTLTP